jgi:DNA-binding response OmpR family regulator
MNELCGLSVLLLEDEYLIALDAQDILTGMGVTDIKVANTIAVANELADNGRVDLAILDLNINGQMSYVVAEKLRQHGTSIVFATGYELREDRNHAQLENSVYLKKPYTSDSLREAVETALRNGESNRLAGLIHGNKRFERRM